MASYTRKLEGKVAITPSEQNYSIKWQQVLLTFALWIASSAVISTATYFALHTFAPEWGGTDGPIVVMVAEVYFLFLPSVLLVFGGWVGLRDKLNFQYTSRGDLLLGLGAYVIVLGVSVLLYWVLSPVLGPLPQTMLAILRDASDMSRLPNADAFTWFFIIVRACLLAPVVEELLFRGLLFGWLRSHYSAWLTILVTAIAFMLVHYYPILFPFAFVFGVIAGWVRERTGSSLVMVAAHIVNSVLFLTVAYILVTR
jgi:membrane protease YdiL (CAAX protease family)